MKFLIPLFFMLSCLISFCQELPPIEKFTPEDYQADNQNWMISQNLDKYVYVANNRGLLEYNGAKWTTYTSPNNTIIRAVNVIDNKIYTGCYAEFGYWIKNELGVLEYVSLPSKQDKKIIEDEQIWNIIDYNEWVIFQSSHKIYFYNTKTENFKIIPASDNIYKIFKVKNRIYYHVANQGLYVIENGEPKLIIDSPVVKSGRVISLFENEESLIVLTRNYGFYKFQNNKIEPWQIPADTVLKATNVFSGIQLKDGSFVVGTISDGVIHLDQQGNIKYQITQKKGLSNNTVLSLFEDEANNVWLGLDNGINCINVTSPIKTFFDYEGVLGTVYTTQVFKDVLYIGSNQGLFYRTLNGGNESFEFIEGTAGQVWDLFNYKDENLFCGHHLGTFVIDGKKANKISDELGAWTFKEIPKQENLLLQGNYSGLFILENKNGLWKVRNKIEGFNNSSRYVEINSKYETWVSHEYKGVFKLKLNDSFAKVEKLEIETSLPLGKNSSLIKYKDAIIYASEGGVFKYNEAYKSFKRDSVLSKTVKNGDYISGKLVVDKKEKLWTFSKDYISYINNDAITNKLVINNIPIPSKLRKGVLGYENISLIKNSTYVLGTANGYITLDVSKIHKEETYSIYLNSVSLKNDDDEILKYAISDEGAFDHKAGILLFEYSVPEYDNYLDVKYQYKLEGGLDKWSKWTEKSQVTFENLSFGDYTFNVRAKVGDKLSENIASYSFYVQRPWYISNAALFFYALLLLIIILITHRAYKRHYVKKFSRDQLESEQALMQINNEKLNQDIENKNRELAISTMSIIKKNRVLNKIKKELKKNKSTNNSVALKLIDNNLNDSKDWSFFEQAFNNADKDFLEKIKLSHPDLTPNDLRFCAYLRLNLSSKEMAPLLNISVKSVETKRYRLRKKLGLEHDSGLVDYILKF
ncbi:triple tyrosine motif-containing protein [Algibacter sp. 2305UL17-15]|uniref:triple tyrosine motif-containing protein n=1 Tax=Algibacter sp. 2305UL17-15 TaxID=3231268 RepID=UPI00345AB782